MTEHIPFIVNASGTPSDGNVKGGIFAAVSEQVCRLIPVDALRRNLQEVSTAMMTALTDLETIGQFRLVKVELQAEVTAEGGAQLVGSSKFGGKGAIKLKFVMTAADAT